MDFNADQHLAIMKATGGLGFAQNRTRGGNRFKDGPLVYY